MKRRFTFTISHALVASLAIHAALVAPFVLPAWMPPLDEEEPLVIELSGLTATSQSEEKIVQETKDEEAKDKTEPTKPEQVVQPDPQQQPQEEKPLEKEAELPPPAEREAERSPSASTPEQQLEEAKAGKAGANNVEGATEQQQAQTIKVDPVTERELLQKYVTLLSKKVQANLIYPDDARGARLQGVPVVSFTVLANGQIRPETLRIVTSSGKPKLDAAALKTITASAPFDPPPREMTIAIDVFYGDMGKSYH